MRPNHAGSPRVVVVDTAAQAAATAATELAEGIRNAVDERGAATIAVSGGSTPRLMLEHLAGLDVPWPAVTVYQVDERIGPADDPTRNLSGLLSALPEVARARVVPMPVEAEDLRRAAAAYARLLPEILDVIHLGLGADGHTASLIPADPVLRVTDQDVALTGRYQSRHRMTLTYPRLRRTRAILWLVTGADKREALTRLLAADRRIPAGSLEGGAQIIVCDIPAHGRSAVVRAPEA